MNGLLQTGNSFGQLDLIMHTAGTWVNDGAELIKKDDHPQVSKVQKLIQENQLLLQQKNALKTGPFGLQKGRTTAMLITGLGAIMFFIDIGVGIADEILSGDDRKFVQFIPIPLNIMVILLSAGSAYFWSRYAGHLKKVVKSPPVKDSEIERLQRQQNVLIPIEHFLANKRTEDRPILLQALQQFAREYDYLSQDVKDQYPNKDGIIAWLINQLDPQHPLRREYEVAAGIANDVIPAHQSDDDMYEHSDDDNGIEVYVEESPQPMSASMGWNFIRKHVNEQIEKTRARQKLERQWGFPVNNLVAGDHVSNRYGTPVKKEDLKSSVESI